MASYSRPPPEKPPQRGITHGSGPSVVYSMVFTGGVEADETLAHE